MAGTITHEWNGTILTITSDSGTSSADLRGEKGDTGPRGVQGLQGNSSDGEVFSVNYKCGDVILTAADVGALPEDTVIPSLDGYATEEYVGAKIAEAQLDGGEVDMSIYALKTEIPVKHSELIDDVGLATQAQIEGMATEEYVMNAINAIPATDLTDYYTKQETEAKVNEIVPEWARQADKPEYTTNDITDLPMVAKSGSYNDLLEKPYYGMVFSETEQPTGGIWFDGKPIYCVSKLYQNIVCAGVGQWTAVGEMPIDTLSSEYNVIDFDMRICVGGFNPIHTKSVFLRLPVFGANGTIMTPWNSDNSINFNVVNTNTKPFETSDVLLTIYYTKN